MFQFSYFHTIEAIHIISVISWMAALLYLPRLFVYHADVEKGSESYSLFKIMERRLLFIICIPAMIATLLSGITIAVLSEAYNEFWFHLKSVSITGLLFMNYKCYAYYVNFKKDKNKSSSRYFKIFNEGVTILMIITVLCAVIKPQN